MNVKYIFKTILPSGDSPIPVRDHQAIPISSIQTVTNLILVCYYHILGFFFAQFQLKGNISNDRSTQLVALLVTSMVPTVPSAT